MGSVTYEDVAAGLNARLATVDGIKVVLDYEPTSAQDSPLIYSVLDSFGAEGGGTAVQTTYRTLHRLCVSWQDSEAAEREIRRLVDAIPLAIRQDPRLAGRIGRGVAEITSGDGGWVSIGGTEYRTIDFYSEVLVYGPYPAPKG